MMIHLTVEIDNIEEATVRAVAHELHEDLNQQMATFSFSDVKTAVAVGVPLLPLPAMDYDSEELEEDPPHKHFRLACPMCASYEKCAHR